MDQPPPNGTDRRLALLEYAMGELKQELEKARSEVSAIRAGQNRALYAMLTIAGGVLATLVAVIIR